MNDNPQSVANHFSYWFVVLIKSRRGTRSHAQAGASLKSVWESAVYPAMIKNSALVFFFSCALCACSSSSGDSPADGGAGCPNLAGTWKVTAHCDPTLIGDDAIVTQTGCSLSFAPPFDMFTGSVSANGKITLSGPQSCAGTAATSTLSLSCTPGTCTVTLTRPAP